MPTTLTILRNNSHFAFDRILLGLGNYHWLDVIRLVAETPHYTLCLRCLSGSPPPDQKPVIVFACARHCREEDSKTGVGQRYGGVDGAIL